MTGLGEEGLTSFEGVDLYIQTLVNFVPEDTESLLKSKKSFQRNQIKPILLSYKAPFRSNLQKNTGTVSSLSGG